MISSIVDDSAMYMESAGYYRGGFMDMPQGMYRRFINAEKFSNKVSLEAKDRFERAAPKGGHFKQHNKWFGATVKALYERIQKSESKWEAIQYYYAINRVDELRLDLLSIKRIQRGQYYVLSNERITYIRKRYANYFPRYI
jgi:hypothetical protein